MAFPCVITAGYGEYIRAFVGVNNQVRLRLWIFGDENQNMILCYLRFPCVGKTKCVIFDYFIWFKNNFRGNPGGSNNIGNFVLMIINVSNGLGANSG